MIPYYRRAGVTIYHGDCRQLLLDLAGPYDVVITDPVWPHPLPQLAGAAAPAGLFREAAALLPALCGRLVVQLGCDSDPRFLLGVPPSLPFFRLCWLPYAVPSYKGRLLYSGDVAYAFGTPPPSRPGRRVIDGEAPRRTDKQPSREAHPCQRRLAHASWLVSRFAAGAVLDPFAGAGTTLLAAKYGGWPATGIEIEERYCEVAARRLEQDVFPFPEAPR
jgi:site-specific DNA-methyltransferase (adenine-specific)